MKKKYIAILLGLTLGMTTLAGCSGTSTSTNSTTQESQSVTETSDKTVSEAETADVYGEVTAVSEDSITIKVGTMKQMEKPDGEGTPSMLDLTDEEKEIKITDDTVIVRSSMGGMAGGPQGNGGTPPEKPESNSDSSDSSDSSGNNNSQPPEMPDNSGNGGVPDMQQETEEISLSDISEGDTVAITYDEDGNAAKITVISMEMGGQMGQPGGGSRSNQGVDSYDAVNTYTSDTEVDGETIASTGTDENAVNVSEGASVTLKDATITRDSTESTGGDNSSFYGVGAAVLATDGNAYVKGGTVTTDAAGGDGYCNLYIGEDATWTVTGDSTVSALRCAGTIEDNEGKTVTVKGTDGTVYVKGDGSYTITVTSYEDSADLSGASTTTSWSAYETEKPSALE